MPRICVDNTQGEAEPQWKPKLRLDQLLLARCDEKSLGRLLAEIDEKLFDVSGLFALPAT